MATRLLVLLVMSWVAVTDLRVRAQTPEPAPALSVALRRGTEYLLAEVPRWRREHPCYSCHNNGDGMRALMLAAERGLIDVQQVNDAAAWLRSPERWSRQPQEGGVKDDALAHIQFTAALSALSDAGGAGRSTVDRALDLVAGDQRADGSWAISATSNVGTPTGYGTPLATALARSALRRGTSDPVRAAGTKADRWLRQFEPQAVLEASAVLVGLAAAADPPAALARQRALGILKSGQAPDGGWGPYTTAPSEPFDTALALIALRAYQEDVALGRPTMSDAERLAALARGRAYLLSQQNADGSWPETTRPSGQDSYSQRISTTAWALHALFLE